MSADGTVSHQSSNTTHPSTHHHLQLHHHYNQHHQQNQNQQLRTHVIMSSEDAASGRKPDPWFGLEITGSVRNLSPSLWDMTHLTSNRCKQPIRTGRTFLETARLRSTITAVDKADRESRGRILEWGRPHRSHLNPD